MLALLALLLLQTAAPDSTDAAPPPPPLAQEAPAAEVGPERISVGFRPILGAFYSPTKGVGVGVGAKVGNLGWPGTETYLSAEVMQRFTRFRAAFFTGDPFHARTFAGVGGEYAGTSVRRFFGIGPRSSERDQMNVSLDEVEAEVRLGWYPLGTGRLLVQPVVRLLHASVEAVEDDRAGAFARLDPASQQNLLRAIGTPTTGLTYGLEVAVDGRDRLAYATRGTLLLLTGRRYDGLGDTPFRYWSATGTLFHFVPLGGRHVLGGRGVVALTEPIGDEPLPFYALPVLDDTLLGAFTSHRFVGHDLVALSAEYRFPLFELFGWYAVDGAVQVHVANAYDDVFEQFEPGVTFEQDLRGEGERTPLRPSLALGGRIVNLDGERVLIGGVIGMSAEGVAFGSLRLVYGIRDVRPLVR